MSYLIKLYLRRTAPYWVSTLLLNAVKRRNKHVECHLLRLYLPCIEPEWGGRVHRQGEADEIRLTCLAHNIHSIPPALQSSEFIQIMLKLWFTALQLQWIAKSSARNFILNVSISVQSPVILFYCCFAKRFPLAHITDESRNYKNNLNNSEHVQSAPYKFYKYVVINHHAKLQMRQHFSTEHSVNSFLCSHILSSRHFDFIKCTYVFWKKSRTYFEITC